MRCRSSNRNRPLDLTDAGDPQLSFRLARPVSDLTFRQILLSTRSEAERLKQIAEFLPELSRASSAASSTSKTLLRATGTAAAIADIE